MRTTSTEVIKLPLRRNSKNRLVLTGHDAAIAEAARLTDEQTIPDESVKQEISNLLQLASTDSNLVLNIVYFVPATRQLRGDHRAHQEAYTARKVPYHGHRHPHPGGGYCGGCCFIICREMQKKAY